jgi:hypothetical protein
VAYRALARQRSRNKNVTTAVVRQRSARNRRMVVSARSGKQKLNTNRGTVFSVRLVPRCYKQDKSRVWSSRVSGVE